MWTLNIYGFRFGALLELLGSFFWEYESLVKKVSLSIYLILTSETLKDDERANYVVSTLILQNRHFCVLLQQRTQYVPSKAFYTAIITENKGTMVSQGFTCKTWRNTRELLWIISNIDYFCYLQLWDQIHIVKLFRKITEKSTLFLKKCQQCK